MAIQATAFSSPKQMTACGTSPLALRLSDAALLKELMYPKKVLALSSFAGNYL